MDASFTRQWLAVSSLPLLVLGALIVYHLLFRLGGLLCRRRITPEKIREHKYRRVGEFALLMQVFYLTLATKVGEPTGSARNSARARPSRSPSALVRTMVVQPPRLMHARILSQQFRASPLSRSACQVFQVFDCSELPDGTRELEAAPEMKCWEGEHTQLVLLGVVALFGARRIVWVPAVRSELRAWVSQASFSDAHHACGIALRRPARLPPHRARFPPPQPSCVPHMHWATLPSSSTASLPHLFTPA